MFHFSTSGFDMRTHSLRLGNKMGGIFFAPLGISSPRHIESPQVTNSKTHRNLYTRGEEISKIQHQIHF